MSCLPKNPLKSGFLRFLYIKNTMTFMSETFGIRTRNIFDPASREPFKLSRSKLELFNECALCFYLDRRLGISRPPMFPFTLNNAVDALMKKEFDIHRAKSSAHPLMEKYGIDAVPFIHEDMEKWRANFVGIQYHPQPTNLIITGAVDDVWTDRKGNLMIVDYKATSTDQAIDMDSEYRRGYKRQVEIYQWIFRRKGFSVSDTAYFVYANGQKDRSAFDGKLEFTVQIFAHKGNDAWVEPTIVKARECLMLEKRPEMNPACTYCSYRKE